jgi:hypothetical protein
MSVCSVACRSPAPACLPPSLCRTVACGGLRPSLRPPHLTTPNIEIITLGSIFNNLRAQKLNIQYFGPKILNIQYSVAIGSGNVQHSPSSETQYSTFSGLKNSNIQYSCSSKTQYSIFSDFKTQYSIFQYSVWWPKNQLKRKQYSST